MDSFFVADDITGENRDLFVNAAGVTRVMKDWRSFYELAETELPNRIFRLRLGTTIGALGWDGPEVEQAYP